MSDQVMIQYSDDHGYSWSAEMKYTMQSAGDRLRRVVLHNQGSCQQRIYRIAYSGNAAFTLVSGHARIGFQNG